MNMSSWSSAGRQKRRTKGTCIQSRLDGTSKFDGFYTISMDYRSGLSILEEKIPHNLLLFVLHEFLYRESLWFWYILIYSTYSLIIPKKFELRDIPFLFYHCQFISMKIVTCRGRGEGERKREVKEDSLMKCYITLVSVHLVFKILAFDKIYLNVLFLNNDQFKKRGKFSYFVFTKA